MLVERRRRRRRRLLLLLLRRLLLRLRRRHPCRLCYQLDLKSAHHIWPVYLHTLHFGIRAMSLRTLQVQTYALGAQLCDHSLARRRSWGVDECRSSSPLCFLLTPRDVMAWCAQQVSLHARIFVQTHMTATCTYPCAHRIRWTCMCVCVCVCGCIGAYNIYRYMIFHPVCHRHRE